MSDPMPGKSHDFIVRLDGLHLDEASRHRIAGAIQATVLAELGRLDLAGTRPSSNLAYFPIKWRGIWLREAATLPEGLGELGKPLVVSER